MVGHRVWEPSWLMVQLVALRHHTNSYHPPHSCVNDGHLKHHKPPDFKNVVRGKSYPSYILIRVTDTYD